VRTFVLFCGICEEERKKQEEEANLMDEMPFAGDGELSKEERFQLLLSQVNL